MSIKEKVVKKAKKKNILITMLSADHGKYLPPKYPMGSIYPPADPLGSIYPPACVNLYALPKPGLTILNVGG